MKKLLFVLLSVLMFASCYTDKSNVTPPRKLEHRAGYYDSIPIYGPKKVWSVEQKQYIDSWGKIKDSIIPLVEYEVVMSGEQVNSINNSHDGEERRKAGITILIIATILIVATAGYWSKSTAVWIYRGIALVVGAALYFFFLQPSDIATLNHKTITEKQLKHYQKIDPELNYFWDSIHKAKKIIGVKYVD